MSLKSSYEVRRLSLSFGCGTEMRVMYVLNEQQFFVNIDRTRAQMLQYNAVTCLCEHSDRVRHTTKPARHIRTKHRNVMQSPAR